MRNNKVAVMPAGTYWIGDLCYVMHDVWDEFCEKAYDSKTGQANNGVMVLNNGVQVAWFNTMYGDGTYNDVQRREYPVDAGLIGCIRIDNINAGKDNDMYGGHTVNFAKAFECGYEDGLIWFGYGKDAVDIETGDIGEYDDEEYELEDEESN